MSTTTQQCKCDRCGEGDIEWLDKYCQECWEYYTAQVWWESVPITQEDAVSKEQEPEQAARFAGRAGQWF